MMGTVALNDATGKVSLLIPTAQIGGFFLGPTIVGLFLTPGSLAAGEHGGVSLLRAGAGAVHSRRQPRQGASRAASATEGRGRG